MYNIYTGTCRCMFINVSWMQQHIPLPLWTCAPLNRATLAMGGYSWCRPPHKPSHIPYKAIQQVLQLSWLHEHDWGTKASTCVQSMPIAVLLRLLWVHSCCIALLACSQSYWQVICVSNSLPQLPTCTCGCFAAVICALQLFPVFEIYSPARVDLKPLPRMTNRNINLLWPNIIRNMIRK